MHILINGTLKQAFAKKKYIRYDQIIIIFIHNKVFYEIYLKMDRKKRNILN